MTSSVAIHTKENMEMLSSTPSDKRTLTDFFLHFILAQYNLLGVYFLLHVISTSPAAPAVAAVIAAAISRVKSDQALIKGWTAQQAAAAAAEKR